MQWYDWLLLGVFGPYALMLVIYVNWGVFAVVRKFRYRIATKLDAPRPIFAIGQRKSGMYFIVAKKAGTHKVVTHLFDNLPEVSSELDAFFAPALEESHG